MKVLEEPIRGSVRGKSDFMLQAVAAPIRTFLQSLPIPKVIPLTSCESLSRCTTFTV